MKTREELLQLVREWLEKNDWDREKLEEALTIPGFCAVCGPGTVVEEGDALVWRYPDDSFKVLDFHSPDTIICTVDEDHEIALWDDLFDELSAAAILNELKSLKS